LYVRFALPGRDVLDDFGSVFVDPSAPPDRGNPAARQATRLQCEYLRSVLSDGMVYSVPPSEGSDFSGFFQILSLGMSKKRFVKTTVSALNDKVTFPVLIQEMQVWSQDAEHKLWHPHTMGSTEEVGLNMYEAFGWCLA
jgi:hypothetical protein